MEDADRAEQLCRNRGEKLTQGIMPLWIRREDIAGCLMEMEREGSASKQRNKFQDIVGTLKTMTQESNLEICKYLREKLNWLTADERDQRIIETLYELTNTQSISELQQLDKKTLRTALALVRDSGVPVNRIAHLTGVPIGVIRYAKVKLLR